MNQMIVTKKTKIVATLGPACDSVDQISSLIGAGVNVFRFNMKHNEYAWHEERMIRVRQVAQQMAAVVGILIDLQGPEIRIATRDQQVVNLASGQEVVFGNSFADPTVQIQLSHENILHSLVAGDSLLIDDGFVELVVVKREADKVVARSLEAAVIKNHKGLNIPAKEIDLPSLTASDLEKLELAAKLRADFVGLSFCRTKTDLEILKKEMATRGVSAKIVAKIENQQALNNIDEIIENADAVMVARGDLGVEVPMEQLAFWQTEMINKCRLAGKPVIVATQMLQSMIDNPRPTRAEVTDVANAVLQGTDAVMLSGETASGKYPVKTVEIMAQIANYNEQKAKVLELNQSPTTMTQLIALGGAQILRQTGKLAIDAILVFTQTGRTAEVISSFRSTVPIIAVTDQQDSIGKLTLSYGVNPVFEEFPSGEFLTPTAVVTRLVAKGVFKKDQTILVVHGQHWKTPGLTNSLSIITV